MLVHGQLCVQSMGEPAKQGQQHEAPPPPVVRQQPMQQIKQPHISLNLPILKAHSMNKTTIMARNTYTPIIKISMLRFVTVLWYDGLMEGAADGAPINVSTSKFAETLSPPQIHLFTKAVALSTEIQSKYQQYSNSCPSLRRVTSVATPTSRRSTRVRLSKPPLWKVLPGMYGFKWSSSVTPKSPNMVR